jgi:hypothetical protein
VALSPDGRHVALQGEWYSPVVFMEVATGRTVRQLPDLFWGYQDSAAYSPDGGLLAVATRNNRIRLWEPSTGRLRRELPAFPTGTFGLAFAPDGRTLAAAGPEGTIRLWEVETGTLRRHLGGHDGTIFAAAFSPDGRLLATAGEDRRVVLHDLTAATPLDFGLNGEALWKALAETNAARAEKALDALRTAPEEALALAGSRLMPVQSLPAERLKQLVGDLDNRRFAVRHEAEQRLEELRGAARPVLRQALEEVPSLEVRRRVERLLDVIEEAPPTPDELRAERVIEFLELSGTPRSRRLLERLADGSAGARMTEAARAALERMGRELR